MVKAVVIEIAMGDPQVIVVVVVDSSISISGSFNPTYVYVPGDAGWRTAPEVLPKAVSQSGRLSQEQHLVLWTRLLLSCLCTSVLNRLFINCV